MKFIHFQFISLNARFVMVAIIFGIGLLSSCNKPATPATSGADSTAAATAAPIAKDEPIAGEYCYDFQDATLHLTAVMQFDGTSKVSGTLYGDIQDKEQGYFTTYATEFTGIRSDANIKVKTITEIEGDVQEEEETWAWDGKSLTEGLHKMKQVDCEPAPEGE